MRTFAIVLFIFFALAPSALAQPAEDDRFGGGQSGGGRTNSGSLDTPRTPAPTGGTQLAVTPTTQSGLTSPTQPGLSQPDNGTNITLINPLRGGASLESFLLDIMEFVIRIGAIIVVLMMVYVGYLFVAARGEPSKITEARTALLWTVVGALILLGSQAIALGIAATVQALSIGG